MSLMALVLSIRGAISVLDILNPSQSMFFERDYILTI